MCGYLYIYNTLGFQNTIIWDDISFITKTLLVLTGEYLDILAISCDSFDEDTNQTIGRAQGRKSHLDNLCKVREWCRKYKVAFKINSVINTFNVDEDMRENITKLNPVRWKVRVFQCINITHQYCCICE